MRIPAFIAILFTLTLGACSLKSNSPENLSADITEAAPQSTPTLIPTPTPVPAVRISNGDEALFLGYYDEAKEAYQTALGQTSDAETQAAALLGMVKTAYEQGDCSSVLNSFQQISTQFPGSEPAVLSNFFAGKCFEQNQDFPSSATAYANMQVSKPGIIDDYLFELIGDTRKNAGNYPEAISSYQAALASTPPGDRDSLMIKIGRSYQSAGNDTEAVRIFLELYNTTQSDFTKATANLLSGQSYINLGLPEQAYARFQDSVNNFPRSYDSYTGLIQLVNDDIPVDELNRGIVDFYSGQYGYALDAFNRYLTDNPTHEGSAHYFKALSLRAMEKNEESVEELDELIRDHKGDRFWNLAWDEKSTTQWAYEDKYAEGAQTLIDFVAEVPDAVEAPQFLFDAGRIQERGGLLTQAASTWGRLINEYPGADSSYRALFLSAISNYRLDNFPQALLDFQRATILGTDAENQSASHFWVGKTQSALNDLPNALSSWETAAKLDPTGYYGIRGRQMILNENPLTAAPDFDLGYDLEAERLQAGEWLVSTFNLPENSDQENLGEIASDLNYKRGVFFWQLGEFNRAAEEFEKLRLTYSDDPSASFRLIPEFMKFRMYRTAIFTSRQILNLANLTDESSLNAPIYFNHIRFGPYFRELVTLAGQNAQINPLLLFSLIRQESMFQSRVGSSAGAIGLMQLMPATGEEIASNLNWPPEFTAEDLWRPDVNITLGTRYLAQQRDYLNGDMNAALAGYNAGPGNAQTWQELAKADPDLFLEIIRYDETRNYLMQITEFLNIYKMIYQSNPG